MNHRKKTGWLFFWGIVSFGLLLEILVNLFLAAKNNFVGWQSQAMCVWCVIALITICQPPLSMRFRQDKLCRAGVVLLAVEVACMYAAYSIDGFVFPIICAVVSLASIVLLVLALLRKSKSAA